MKAFEKDGRARDIELALDDEMDNILVGATDYLELLLLECHSPTNLLVVGH